MPALDLYLSVSRGSHQPVAYLIKNWCLLFLSSSFLITALIDNIGMMPNGDLSEFDEMKSKTQALTLFHVNLRGPKAPDPQSCFSGCCSEVIFNPSWKEVTLI